MFTPTKGMYLATLNPHNFTNAVCIDVVGDTCHILSDFGNVMAMNLATVCELYEPMLSWVEMKALGFPYGSLEERIETQINLLTKAKELIK